MAHRSPRRWRSRSTTGSCGSATPTGSTSRRAARPSSTWSSTTSPSATASSTRCASGRACCTASPPGLAGDKVHQKRLPAGAPPWMETVRLHFPRWNRTADELCVTELAQRDLGGADVDRRVPPVEQPARRHREARRVAHRPRPGAASATSPPCAGSPTSPTRCSTSSAPSGFPKTSGGSGLHVYVRIPPEHGFKDVRRAALAFAREVERRAPDDVTTTWWRKDRDPHAAVRRLQPERPRPHHRGGVLRARQPRGHASRRRSGGTRSTTSSPRDCTIATVPGPVRRARRPARRTSTTHVFDIAPLLEWADRDEADGAEPPADPDDRPRQDARGEERR